MLGRKFRRGLIIQRTMWPMLVVVPAPGSDQDTSLSQTRKPVVIQTTSIAIIDVLRYAPLESAGTLPKCLALLFEQAHLFCSSCRQGGRIVPFPEWLNTDQPSTQSDLNNS